MDFSVSYWVLRFTKGNKITNSESVSEDETWVIDQENNWQNDLRVLPFLSSF